MAAPGFSNEIMFKRILNILFAAVCLTGVFYLALPGYDFPSPPPDSIQSREPADLETPLRRGYFTNFTRAEVLDWYGKQFDKNSFLNLKMPTLLLNYPPENAQTVIRDQTGSTYLQEYSHPFRESLYINGNETPPENLVPQYYVDGKPWDQKIIIKYVPSNLIVRELIFLISMALLALIYKRFWDLFSKSK